MMDMRCGHQNTRIAGTLLMLVPIVILWPIYPMQSVERPTSRSVYIIRYLNGFTHFI